MQLWPLLSAAMQHDASAEAQMLTSHIASALWWRLLCTIYTSSLATYRKIMSLHKGPVSVRSEQPSMIQVQNLGTVSSAVADI